ncbi:MAG: cell surface protein [Candidatus Thiodiazotropha sp.]|nr:cell surface protein [Candidatus Thiodiazotropha sp.]MCU7804354.1 cell surface protein [Candidatus Thiodiazotropha sp. (ex Lucinoma borealis)]MCU7839402.1 cell surface protein [Candidatus Thiodiazotropha sp. (ex Troendleina suluensis)]MCM8882546.1 cell surface protein [Candidatus Thiodiazotropha sp.]MCM8918734.1 cell surface protein [Candidatus Thiodiazotropha sp.]
MNTPSTPMKYLDKAMNRLHDLGLLPTDEDTQEQPIIALLNQISDLDEGRVTAIARTLGKASMFNDVVREQVKAMEIGERYEKITNAFNSIRDDAKRMVEQIDDGKVDSFERISNVWMKVTRGDIASRFDEIKETYLDVTSSSNDQIQREHTILEAYQDFRGALKQSEVLALEVLKTAEGKVDEAKASVAEAMKGVEAYANEDAAERAKLEMTRDQKVRALQKEDKRYQISKDLSDNLTVSYNTSEVVMARLLQTTTAKERVYAQAVSFFSTNEVVLTALTASFTGMFGLHEGTQTIEAMKEGVSKSLEDLAEIGGKVQEAAVKAGYGPTIRAESVKKLVDSVVNWQTRSHEIIAEMRRLSTQNADEIREAVEEGKRQLARLAEEGKGLDAELDA